MQAVGAVHVEVALELLGWRRRCRPCVAQGRRIRGLWRGGGTGADNYHPEGASAMNMERWCGDRHSKFTFLSSEPVIIPAHARSDPSSAAVSLSTRTARSLATYTACITTCTNAILARMLSPSDMTSPIVDSAYIFEKFVDRSMTARDLQVFVAELTSLALQLRTCLANSSSSCPSSTTSTSGFRSIIPNPALARKHYLESMRASLYLRSKN